MNWELHGSDGHFEIQDMDESRRVALIRFATLKEARLMTAAPKMLKALKVALENSRRRSEGRGKWTVKDQEAHDALRAAITESRPENKVEHRECGILRKIEE